MKISEVYKKYVKDGMNKKQAAGICLGVITGGMIDATDDETYSRLIQEFVNKQEK
jgi:hypothetical protein